MTIHLESEQEQDGRWLAEVPELPGLLAFDDGEEVGPRMLDRIAKHTGLHPDDLR